MLVENRSLARAHVKVSACKFTEFFPSPNHFAGFTMERVESDPQQTFSEGDFFPSHISEFSPPPKLQHTSSPVPSCQVSAIRNWVGNRSLDHFHNGEKSIVLFGLAGE